mmetsp:Transcript_106804/g.297307  ORF Transcript_106804/g.297307 Transcript_106804/m.297307 type:complete len:212 (+) Transcript_106804:72-707(+)
MPKKNASPVIALAKGRPVSVTRACWVHVVRKEPRGSHATPRIVGKPNHEGLAQGAAKPQRRIATLGLTQHHGARRALAIALPAGDILEVVSQPATGGVPWPAAATEVPVVAVPALGRQRAKAAARLLRSVHHEALGQLATEVRWQVTALGLAQGKRPGGALAAADEIAGAVGGVPTEGRGVRGARASGVCVVRHHAAHPGAAPRLRGAADH